MNISDFLIPLTEPLVINTGETRRVFSCRRGYRLTLVGRTDVWNEYSGTGELVEPVFLTEKDNDPLTVLEEARHHLQCVLTALQGKRIDISSFRNELEQLLCQLDDGGLAAAIASFAIEQAFLVLVARARSDSLSSVIHEYIFDKRSTRFGHCVLKINTLYNTRGGGDTPADNANGAVKIKVGNKDVVEDADIINRFIAHQPANDCRVRIDVNRMWNIDEAVRFVENLSECAVRAMEYIEEPVNVASIGELRAAINELRLRSVTWSCIPIGIDESMLLPGIEEILTDDPKLQLIYKPSLHGIRKWKQFLKRHPNRITVTCTFETGVGLLFLTNLAFALNPDAYHGIHALPDMVKNDFSTKRFSELVSGGDSIVISDLVDVMSS